MLRGLRKTRGLLYWLARLLGDVIAVGSGPGAIARRGANKLIGRGLVRRMFFRR